MNEDQAREMRAVIEREVTFGMVEAGGRAVAACLADPWLMTAPNRAGEIAARAYAAMWLAASTDPPKP